MSTLQQAFPSLSIRQLCALLGVSRSWFYERAQVPTQAERDVALRDAIERIVLEFPGYGYRRVTAELHRQQWEVNHKRVLRIMRAESLLCQLKRSWVPTTDSRHGLRTYANLLAGLVVSRPNQAWVADSTLSGSRRRSSIWLACATPGHAAVSAGSAHAPSTRSSRSLHATRPLPCVSRRPG